MTSFDADILTALLHGDPAFLQRVNQIPGSDRSVPIVVVEELVRGRLNTIRQAEAGKGTSQ